MSDSFQPRRRLLGQPQTHFQALAVVQRQRSPLPVVLLALERRAVPPAQPSQQALDVLARPQRVAREVGTRAVIVEQPGPAHRHAISFAARGLHVVVAVGSASRPRHYLLDSLSPSLLTGLDLLLDQHRPTLPATRIAARIATVRQGMHNPARTESLIPLAIRAMPTGRVPSPPDPRTARLESGGHRHAHDTAG